jgi:hypothetical protein
MCVCPSSHRIFPTSYRYQYTYLRTRQHTYHKTNACASTIDVKRRLPSSLLVLQMLRNSVFKTQWRGCIPAATFRTCTARTVHSHQQQQQQQQQQDMQQVPSWATVDPKLLGTSSTPYIVQNIVNGTWQTTNATTTTTIDVPHPYNTDVVHPIFTVPDTTNIQPYIQSLRACPKTGLHNPYKNVERYIQYGEISRLVRLSFRGNTHKIPMSFRFSFFG